MKTLAWLNVSIVLLGGCASAGTRDQGDVTPPSGRVSCEDYASIGKWEVPSVEPIAVVGHGAMLDAAGRELATTPAFVTQAQRYYLKTLFMHAKDAERVDAQKKQQRLCPERSLSPEDNAVVNAALISWLIATVKPDDALRLATNSAVLVKDAMASPALRARLEAEGQYR